MIFLFYIHHVLDNNTTFVFFSLSYSNGLYNFSKYFVINIRDNSIDVNVDVNAYIFTGLRFSSR
jgi:hypothetical protein